MHGLKQSEQWDPFPDARFEGDAAHRHEANGALWLSALGLTLTGGIELAIALVSGSVGLLGDGIHNLSDVSTSLVGFLGFRVSKRPASPSIHMAMSGPRTWLVLVWRSSFGPVPFSPGT